MASVTSLPFENIGGLIIDMDGVLWHGNQALPGLTDFFQFIQSKNIPFILATNNASLTSQSYIEKLSRMGVCVEQNKVFTSSMATAQYLRDNLPEDTRRVFVIGEEGLKQPLLEQGFQLTDLYQVDQPAKGITGQGAQIVVSGLDRKLTWDKLATATINIKNGAQFFATNADKTLPTELGEVMGNGGVIAALEASTGVKPISIGKPEAVFYEQALSILGGDKNNIIAIGDRLDTDILGAVNLGIRSLMLLTGVSTREDIDDIDYAPTWVMNDLPELTEAMKKIFE